MIHLYSCYHPKYTQREVVGRNSRLKLQLGSGFGIANQTTSF